jgi:SAM-dependent methyltransferase
MTLPADLASPRLGPLDRPSEGVLVMSLIGQIHAGYVHGRRAQVLAGLLAEMLPRGARVLDVGSGDGLVAYLTSRKRPDVRVTGVDLLVRPRTYIPVEAFDGRVIPYGDASFDVVTFIDVLHHLEDLTPLLQEAVRVAREGLLIKDHLLKGFLARPTLRVMDWVSNAPHGIALPYNYWPEERWRQAFTALGLEVRAWKDSLNLYPRVVNWLFGRSLHFVAQLSVTRGGQAAASGSGAEAARPRPSEEGPRWTVGETATLDRQGGSSSDAAGVDSPRPLGR